MNTNNKLNEVLCQCEVLVDDSEMQRPGGGRRPHQWRLDIRASEIGVGTTSVKILTCLRLRLAR